VDLTAPFTAADWKEESRRLLHKLVDDLVDHTPTLRRLPGCWALPALTLFCFPCRPNAKSAEKHDCKTQLGLAAQVWGTSA